MSEVTEQSQMKRVPNECAYTFVWRNFYGLAQYYANIYSRCIRKPIMFEDIRDDILHGMVAAYESHRDRPVGELVKICKSVPFHYYDSKLMRKDNQPKLDISQFNHEGGDLGNQNNSSLFRPGDVLSLSVDQDRIDSFYDLYFDKFITEHYTLNREDWTDEKQVLMEIIYPSKEYQAYLSEECCGINRITLFKFFRAKHKWSKRYFDKVFLNIKIAA